MAIETLRRMTAADREPLVSDAELWEMLELCRRRDDSGRAPLDPEWEPAYDLNLAAAMVFDAKAAAVANEFDVNADGVNLARSQLHAHFLVQADRHRRRVAGRSL